MDDQIAVEVKRCQKLQLKPWLEKLREIAPPWCKPVLAYRQNNERWHVLVDMDEVSFASYRMWLEHPAPVDKINGQ